MKSTQNKYYSKNNKKFINWIKGKSENKYFFVLPSIVISPKRNLHWDMTIKSIFFGIGRFYMQCNMCEIVKDNSLELTKEFYEKLLQGLKLCSLKVNDTTSCLEFLKNNIFIIQILRNSSIEHPYVRKVLQSYFTNQPFISPS